jgi:hypothetical protein
MTGWKDVMQMVISTLGNDAESHACILDFLKVLPEEVTEGRKINLTVCGPKNTILRALQGRWVGKGIPVSRSNASN